MPDLLDQLPDRRIAGHLVMLAEAITDCQAVCRESGLPVLIQLSERAPRQLTELAASCPHAPIRQLRRYQKQGTKIAHRVVEWLEAAPVILARTSPSRTIHPAAAYLVPALHQAARDISRLQPRPQLTPQDPTWWHAA